MLYNVREMETLVAYIDGGSRGNPGHSACGVYLPQTEEKLGRYLGDDLTNNEAEYCALIAALEIAAARGAKRLRVYTDSQVVTFQIQGKYRVNSETLLPYWAEAKAAIDLFEQFEIIHTKRDGNPHADKIVNEVLDGQLLR
jgi:ribonuclease HI